GGLDRADVVDDACLGERNRATPRWYAAGGRADDERRGEVALSGGRRHLGHGRTCHRHVHVRPRPRRPAGRWLTRGRRAGRGTAGRPARAGRGARWWPARGGWGAGRRGTGRRGAGRRLARARWSTGRRIAGPHKRYVVGVVRALRVPPVQIDLRGAHGGGER